MDWEKVSSGKRDNKKNIARAGKTVDHCLPAYFFIPETVGEERIVSLASTFFIAPLPEGEKSFRGTNAPRSCSQVARFPREENEGENAEQENRSPWLVSTTMANRLEYGTGVPTTFVSHLTRNFKVVKLLNEIFIPIWSHSALEKRAN